MYAGVDPLTGGDLRLKETHESWSEAQLALTKLQRLVDENKHPKSSITVGEAIGKWMEVAELEVTTRDRYEDLIRLYIAPKFGDFKLKKLNAELLERFYARLHRCKDLCPARPPSTATAVRVCRGRLRFAGR